MNNKALRWLFTIPGRKNLYILALTVFQVLFGASGVFYALLLKDIVNAAVGHDSIGFRNSLLLILLLMAGQLLLRALIRWFTEAGKASFENLYKARLMKTILHKDLLQVSAVHSGEWMNRLTNDAKVVADHSIDILPGLSGMAVKLVSALIMILVLEPYLALIFLIAGALLLGLSVLIRKRLKQLHKNIQESDGSLRIFLQERLGSLLMIHSFAAEEQTEKDMEEYLQEHKKARMHRIRFSNVANVGFGIAINGMYLLGIGWCGYGILRGSISFGTLTAITQLISQIQSPIVNLSSYLPRYYAMIASAERLMEAENFLDDGGEARPVGDIIEFYNRELKNIGLDKVSFSYDPAMEEEGAGTLDHVSLKIEKSETVAFTGRSGCGKSTALKVLMCAYRPDSGERYYKDLNGVKHPLTSELRRLFAYVPQGNYLMKGTIREVISFSSPEDSRDEERIKRALNIACAADFIRELEKGIDTPLGEHGSGLSEGQMQRLAIARAVFSGSPVLLLDESTSALDYETEKQLLSNIRNMTDKTVIIVTHRSEVLEICDRVIEFK